ncbi:MAG TPA: MBL fold metallo-hydrolase [Burkholderiales bacterium]|nr:MBL fold metallo-hydrolase [Burkholderiales bacterium]
MKSPRMPALRTRRSFLQGAAALAAASLSPVAFAQGARTRLVLLGTGGGPRVTAKGRAKPATLIVANNIPYVIDCGDGVALQLVRAGFGLDALRYVFITHHHSDHNLDYGNLIYDAWAAGLRKPVDAYGPPPLAAMTDAWFQLNRFDIETRIADEGRVDLRKLVTAHEFAKDGQVMRNEDVRVTAARVRHPPIEHAYAYRFDCPDRSIVISGDTTVSPELVALAKGADVLVCEAMHLAGLERLLAKVPNAATLREHLLASHIVTEDLGKLAAEAGVKTLVMSHLVPGDDPSITEAMWTEGVRKHYGGTIVVGRDLLEL